MKETPNSKHAKGTFLIYQTSLWGVLCSGNFPKTYGNRATEHSNGVTLEESCYPSQKSKHKFMVPTESYLGYMIEQVGLHPLPEKVKAVKDAPCPQTIIKVTSQSLKLL